MPAIQLAFAALITRSWARGLSTPTGLSLASLTPSLLFPRTCLRHGRIECSQHDWADVVNHSRMSILVFANPMKEMWWPVSCHAR